MSMNDTPRSERVHIAFFGRRNVGKSSLVNAVTNQQMSIVSDVKGTTTDPVVKSMELLPLGPVVIIDTPGFDDEGELGRLRVQRTREILGRTDVAVLVADALAGLTAGDLELLHLFEEQKTPCVLAWNKSDLAAGASGAQTMAGRTEGCGESGIGENALQDRIRTVPETAVIAQQIFVSALTGANIPQLKEAVARAGKKVEAEQERPLIGDLIRPMDLVLLVIPIDFAAPKGRLILPQVQVLRDALDHGARAMCVRESELAQTLERLRANSGEKPALVITDSQAFGAVSKIVPEDIPMTSFSILMARYKGALKVQLKGIRALKNLKDGDRVLISEGCTHHRQCGDIGTVKLPAWIRQYSGKELIFETSSGLSFPEDLNRYALIVHCGSCMLNEKEVAARNRRAVQQGIPITNYGMTIAEVNGILDRALRVIPQKDKA